MLTPYGKFLALEDPLQHNRRTVFRWAGVRGDAAWKQLVASIAFPKPYVGPPPEPATKPGGK